VLAVVEADDGWDLSISGKAKLRLQELAGGVVLVPEHPQLFQLIMLIIRSQTN
jgi:hypothetical protein